MKTLTSPTIRPGTIRRTRERASKVEPPQARTDRAAIALGLFLFAGTLILYSPLRNHDFINYDDDAYVTGNPQVISGLSWQTVRWALTSTEQGGNWHPVTWLSHALDCQLFGIDAGDHHLDSAFIHAVSVLLCFLLLRKATGAVGPSFVAAALFAWHPFNVESVAWIAERKNVLSTFFLLLTLAAYGWYARKPEWKRSAVVATAFVMALASKPMVVTLPFALLLLDYWPLQRVAGWTKTSAHFSAPQQSVAGLLLEKAPLFALAAAGSAITIWVQKSGGAVRSMQSFPLRARFGNALYSYAIYIAKVFWPRGFSIFYPHPGTSMPVWKPVLAAVLLLAVSVAVLRQRSARPYLVVGWLWFLGTLIPVIGLVQVGDQAMADRYAYLPLLGVFVMLAWGAADCFKSSKFSPALQIASVGAILATLCWLSSRQLDSWQDSISVWSHARRVTPENVTVERYLGRALQDAGNSGDALPHLLTVESLAPNDVANHVSIGALQVGKGQFEEAIVEFETAVKLTDIKELSPKERFYRTSALLNLGFAYALSKNYSQALLSLQRANQCDPQVVDDTAEAMNRSLDARPSEGSYLNLSLLLRAKGKNTEASSILESAIQANPGYTDTRALLHYLSVNPL